MDTYGSPLDTPAQAWHRWQYHGQYGQGSHLAADASGRWWCWTCANASHEAQERRRLAQSAGPVQDTDERSR